MSNSPLYQLCTYVQPESISLTLFTSDIKCFQQATSSFGPRLSQASSAECFVELILGGYDINLHQHIYRNIKCT